MRSSYFLIKARSLALFLFVCLNISSCVTSEPTVRHHINSFVAANRLDLAEREFSRTDARYASNNTLLYYLDKGMVEHSRGYYWKSIGSLAQAQRIYDDLYTRSVSTLLGTWLVNDYVAPYRGEDFEYAMTNVIQALNYAARGDINEALVEARDMDVRLRLLNQIYENHESIYKDDAFARMIMGIVYESTYSEQDANDALIEYRKSVDVFERYNEVYYETTMPNLLKQNFLSLLDYFDDKDYHMYLNRFGNLSYHRWEDKRAKAQVYVIHYLGFSPLKIPQIIPIPVSKNALIKISYPKYHERYYQADHSELVAINSVAHVFRAPTELGQDITQVAKKVLEQKKVKVVAKSALRAAGKYALQDTARDTVEEKYGSTTGDLFNVFANLYNVYSEQADLRSWQTLPAQIRIARLVLEPGEYDLKVKTYDDLGDVLAQESLGKVRLRAGEKKFFTLRSFE